MQASIQTPWGNSQNIETISRGLEFVDTSGHGGIKVSDELNQKIPLWIKGKRSTKHVLALFRRI